MNLYLFLQLTGIEKHYIFNVIVTENANNQTSDDRRS